jgi:hypothetical protein
MIARYNRLSFLFGIPGLIVQAVGFTMRMQGHDLAGRLVILVGLILLMVGLALYAKAIGRNPAWGFVGLLSIIGLLILASLKDYAPNATGEKT